MTDLLTLLQDLVPYYQALSDAADTSTAKLDQDMYDSVEHYLELRQSLLDTQISPRMAQVEFNKLEPFGTDGTFIGETEGRIKGLILQILEKDRCCMEKIQAKRKVLQSSIHELQDGVRAVQGYGHPASRPPLLVEKKA